MSVKTGSVEGFILGGRGRWTLLAFTFALGASPLASAVDVQVRPRVDGLPAGLTVEFRGQFTKCTPNGPQPENPVGTVLEEETTTVIEQVQIPGMPTRFVARQRTRYFGEVVASPPADNGCTQIPNNAFTYSYTVLGETETGSPQGRVASGFTVLNLTPQNGQRNDALKAETLSLLENGVVPTTVQKGENHRFSIQYRDAFGGASVRRPSLVFTQPAFFLGFPITRTVVKMTLTDDGNVCLRFQGLAQQCRSLSQGGTLTNGPVTLNVGQMADSVADRIRFVTWAFRLELAFPAGNFGAVANALDHDPFPYLVDGEPQILDLLPWKALRLPIAVTNPP